MTKIIPKFLRSNLQAKTVQTGENQVHSEFREIIKNNLKSYHDVEVVKQDKIPDTSDIPLHKPKWLEIPNVICVFVDIKNSTLLSAKHYPKSTAKVYQLFTKSAVELFHALNSSYIDIKGDGVFALFNHNEVYRALVSAVTFKTFSDKDLIPKIIKETGLQELGTHIGIDQHKVLVRRIGLKRIEGRTDRQNEVWAGKTVNTASKLASISNHKELIISEKFYNNITDDHARLSCGCVNGEPSSNKTPLWEKIDVSDDTRFYFNEAWKLTSYWCERHGVEFCEKLLKLDEE